MFLILFIYFLCFNSTCILQMAFLNNKYIVPRTKKTPAKNLHFETICIQFKNSQYERNPIFIRKHIIQDAFTYYLCTFPQNDFGQIFQTCEAFWGSNFLQITSRCLYFFLPTMSLMYFYGSIFHKRHLQQGSHQPPRGKRNNPTGQEKSIYRTSNN